MKLSELKGEEALDALCDLIDPTVEIFADSEILETYKTKPKIVLVKTLIKKHKKNIIEILAILNKKTPEEYEKTMSISSLIKEMLDVANDKELTDFFSSQAENMELSVSGSAMVNTEAKET